MGNKKNPYSTFFYYGIFSYVCGFVLGFMAPLFQEGTESLDYIIFLLKAVGIVFIGIYAWNINEFNTLFRSVGLCVNNRYPILKRKKVKNKYCTLYTFKLPNGMKVSDIKKHKDAFEQHFGKIVDINKTKAETFTIEVYNRPRLFNYKKEFIDGNIPILIGQDLKDDKLVFIDLDCDEPNLIIAGTIGGGISNAVRVIITNLIVTTKVKIHLIDCKNGEKLGIFKDCKSVISFSKNIEEAEIFLHNIFNEMEHRLELFHNQEVQDINQYNKKSKTKLTYEIVIVDELQDLKYNKYLFELIYHILRLSRSCGIHMILCTHCPDYYVLNNKIKVNATNLLCFKTKDGDLSKVVINKEDLEHLIGKGHGYFYYKNVKSEIQTPLLSEIDAEKYLKDQRDVIF